VDFSSRGIEETIFLQKKVVENLFALRSECGIPLLYGGTGGETKFEIDAALQHAEAFVLVLQRLDSRLKTASAEKRIPRAKPTGISSGNGLSPTSQQTNMTTSFRRAAMGMRCIRGTNTNPEAATSGRSCSNAGQTCVGASQVDGQLDSPVPTSTRPPSPRDVPPTQMYNARPRPQSNQEPSDSNLRFSGVHAASQIYRVSDKQLPNGCGEGASTMKTFYSPVPVNSVGRAWTEAIHQGVHMSGPQTLSVGPQTLSVGPQTMHEGLYCQQVQPQVVRCGPSIPADLNRLHRTAVASRSNNAITSMFQKKLQVNAARNASLNGHEFFYPLQTSKEISPLVSVVSLQGT